MNFKSVPHFEFQAYICSVMAVIRQNVTFFAPRQQQCQDCIAIPWVFSKNSRARSAIKDLTLSQTSPGFYVSALQVFGNH